jgi:putative peptidoglycan lipid II flippase
VSRGARTIGVGLFASAVLIGVITALARVVGFGRWVAFSESVNAQCVGSAYSAANILPNVLFEVVAGGALAGAVVPLLAGPISRALGVPPGRIHPPAAAAAALADPAESSLPVQGRNEVDRIASALLGWVLLVLIPASLLLAALSVPLSRLLSNEQCAGEQALIARMLLVFAPQIALYGVGVVLSGVLVAHRRFLWPAVAPLLSSLVVIGAYLMFGATADGAQNAPNQLPASAEAWLTWGTTAGVVVMTLPLLIPVTRLGVRLRPSLQFPPGVARRGSALATAGIGALLAQQASVLVVVALAKRSGDTGALPVFQYVQAVYLLPYAVLAVPLATSAFPRLAERAATGDRPGFARTASVSTRAVAVVALLGTAALIAAAPPVARFFDGLDRGDVSGMGPALTVMAPGLLGFGLIAHLGRALYALERGREAAIATVSGWLAVIVGSLVVVRWVSVVPALAWGNTIGMSLAGLLLVLALRRAAGSAATAGLPRVLLAGAVAAAVGGLVGRQIGELLLDALPSGVTGSIMAGAVAGLVAAVVFVVVLALADRPDLTLVLNRVRPGRASEPVPEPALDPEPAFDPELVLDPESAPESAVRPEGDR